MKHRGEIAKKAIDESGIPLAKVAEDVGYTRRHFYNVLENPNLSIDTLLKIGESIHRDFKKDFPEIFGNYKPQVNEEQEKYGGLIDCLKEKNEILLKYTSLLEDHQRLLKQGFEKFIGGGQKKMRKA